MRLDPEIEREVVQNLRHSRAEAEILSDLRENKVAFLYLVAVYKGPVAAYEQLRLTLYRGEKPEQFLHVSQDSFRNLIQNFYGILGRPFEIPAPRPPRPLPQWFIEELKEHIDMGRAGPALPSLASRDMSYWLTAKLLANAGFMAAIEMTRRRWRIGAKPMTWYARMNAFQAKAIDFAHSFGIETILQHGQVKFYLDGGFTTLSESSTLILSQVDPPTRGFGFPYHGEVRFKEPFDNRRTDTYGDSTEHYGYGLPIYDYDRDLDALAWLAGALPGSPPWRRWVETILWNFQNLPFGSEFGSTSGTAFWTTTNRYIWIPGALWCLRNRGNVPIYFEHCGKVRLIPDSEASPTAVMQQERPQEQGFPFTSRWLDLSDYSTKRQPDLVYDIVRRWGKFEPIPGKQNVRRRLEALLRPATVEDALNAIDDEEMDWDSLASADQRARAAARKRKSRLI